MTHAVEEAREDTPPTPRGFDLMFVLMSIALALLVIAAVVILVDRSNLPTHDEVQEQCLASGGEVVMSEDLFGSSYACRGTDGKITRMESRG